MEPEFSFWVIPLVMSGNLGPPQTIACQLIMLVRIVFHRQLGSHLYVVFLYFLKYFMNDTSNDSPYELGQGSHEIVQ